MFGCYLFFFAAFFFAGMISPPVWVSVRFALGGQGLWPTSPTPQYVVAGPAFVKRNLHFSFARPHSRARGADPALQGQQVPIPQTRDRRYFSLW
jgi:hypothetical protein